MPRRRRKLNRLRVVTGRVVGHDEDRRAGVGGLLGAAVRRAIGRMSRLVDDLLALARLEAPAARRQPVALDELAEELAAELAGAAHLAGVLLTGPAGRPAVATGDRDEL